MRRLRVLVLTHCDLVPPASVEGLSEKEIQPWKKEFDVAEGLRELGHHVQVLGLSDDLAPLRQHVEGWRPHVVFNLLMEFQDVAVYQAHVTSYLELLRVPCAGCNPRGLLIARDKALTKRILRAHRVPTPAFTVFPMGAPVRARRDLRYPQIVKSVDEEASLGISQASVVVDERRLLERVEFVHRHVGGGAIAEEYVPGRELTVGVLGNRRLQVLPPWETFFRNLPDGSVPIATERAKWDLAYQQRIGLETGPALELSAKTAARIDVLARRVYRALGLSGYARLDLRLADGERVSVIEVNPNPDLSVEEDFAASAQAAGLAYPALLQRIVNLALRYRSPWKAS